MSAYERADSWIGSQAIETVEGSADIAMLRSGLIFAARLAGIALLHLLRTDNDLTPLKLADR